MKIIKKLKALFLKVEEPVSLDLFAAEIKEGRAILHPKEEPNVTYCVKSDDIEIRLSQGKSLTDKDIMIIKKQRKGEKNPTEQKDMLSTSRKKKQYTNKETVSNSTTVDFSRFKKELFLFLYIQRNTML